MYICYEINSVTGSSGSDDPPPPKPSRVPNASDVSASNSSLGSSAVSGNNGATVSTYIVAQNPEVLVHLLRENENRGLNPSVYTTPASAFNTLAVDFKPKEPNDDGGSVILSAGSFTQSLSSHSDYSKSSLSQNSQSSSELNTLNSSTYSTPMNKSLPRNFGGKSSKLKPHSKKVGASRKYSGSSEDVGSSGDDSSRELQLKRGSSLDRDKVGG